jgi:hypothetical protein
MKYSNGYQCDENMDSIAFDIKNKYKVNSFCDEYPNVPTLDKLSTVFIDTPLEINRTKIRVFSTDDINVNIRSTSEMNKDNSNMKVNPNKDSIIGQYNLMQDECVAKCKESDLCEYAISANSRDASLGTCYLHNRKLDLSKVQRGGGSATNTMFSKVNTVEYSIVFWIKVDNINKNWRNIIHVGDANIERFPGLWITPRNLGFHASLSTKGTGEKKGWGNTEGLIAYNVFQPKKWHHAAFTVNGREASLYVDGKQVSTKMLSGSAQWPGTKKNIYVSDPWHSTGGFHLSKMKWYPFGLSGDFIQNIAFSSYPLKEFKKNLNVVTKTDPDAIILTNGWKSVNDKGSEVGSAKIKDINGIAFIDGIVMGGSANSILGFLPPGRYFDRTVYFNTLGDNGQYTLAIYTNGNIVLWDRNRFPRNREYASYNKDIKIYISIRAPFAKGAALRHRGRAWGSTPGFTQKGSVVYLTGGVGRSTSTGIQLPSSARPAKSDLHNAQGGWGRNRVDVRNNGTVPNILRYSWTQLEGIHYSKFNGDRIQLNRGFWNYSGNNGYWSYAQVILDNGIVLLRGLIVRGGYLGSNNKLIEAPEENSYSAGPGEKRTWRNMASTNPKGCASIAKRYGYNYFKIKDGRCYVSQAYNVTKPSWRDFSKDMAGYPGTISSGSKLVFTKDNNLIRNSLGSGLKDHRGKPILNFVFNKDGSYTIDSRQYANSGFPWKEFYEVTSQFRVTKAEYSGKLDAKAYVAILPSDFEKYDESMPSSVAVKSYLAPPSSDIQNPYIKVGSNQDHDKTTGAIDKVRFIDFTDAVKGFRDGDYQVRLFSGNHTELRTLVTFEIQNGKYIEHSNIMMDEEVAKVYQVAPESNIICRLPQKYSPLEDCYFTTNAHNGNALIKVEKSGNVVFINKFNTGWTGFSLAGISYVVDPIKANSREYKYSFQGECRGKEVLKIRHNKNPGTYEERVNRCAKTCEDVPDVKGFVVHNRTGGCYCEFQHSGKCERVRNAYKRYDFTDASKGALKTIKVNGVITWNDAKKLAEKNGGRLPYSQELRDANIGSGLGVKSDARGKWAYDHWHPIMRPDKKTNDWAQLGTWPGGSRVRKYDSHLDKAGYVGWGNNKSYRHYRINGRRGRNLLYFWSYK